MVSILNIRLNFSINKVLLSLVREQYDFFSKTKSYSALPGKNRQMDESYHAGNCAFLYVQQAYHEGHIPFTKHLFTYLNDA